MRLDIVGTVGVSLLLLSSAALAQGDSGEPPTTAPAAPSPPAAPSATATQSPPPVPAPVVPGPPSAPSAADAPEWKFECHGFVGVSVYVQDTPAFVLNGQGPLLPLSEPTRTMTTGADIRQSRFAFSVAGPRVLGAVPKALLEIDLFGLNGPGGYGEVSVYPRVRLAYAELNWGADILRLGQDHQLIFAMIPESIGHLAYPATYFNGLIGWREPGVGYFHTLHVGDSKLELSAQAIKSDWQNPTDFGQSTVNDLNVDYGQLSGWLGAEARVKLTERSHHRLRRGALQPRGGLPAGDLVAPPTAIPNRDWDVEAGVAGFKAKVVGLTLAASAYVGKNLGPLLGNLLQFPVSNDVREWGGWAQLGYDVTGHLNVWILGGLARPNQSDVEAAGGGRSESSMVGGMIRYQQSGFAFGPEFYHVIAKQISATGAGVAAGSGAPTGVLDVDQLLLSGMYTF